MPIQYNDKIKKPNTPYEYSKEEVDEYIKCSKDVVYFAENYCYTVHPQFGKNKIKLYNYQKEILNNYQNNNLNIIQKTRQTGISTINNIFALHYACFNKDSTIAILSIKQEIAKALLSDIRNMYENLPNFLKPGVELYNMHEVRFDNKCEILAKATSPNALCGLYVHLCILDEFAFVQNDIATEFFNSNFPCIAVTRAKMIISSTRVGENRKTNKFWELWCNAIDGKNDFKPYYVNWNADPYRDQNWKNQYIKQMGIENFNKEYEVSYTHPNPLEYDEDGNKRYTPKEFAKLFNVSTSTVARWRTQGKIIGVEVSSRKYYYTVIDIQRVKDKNILNNVEKSPDRQIFKIDCGDLPPDIVQKYVNELKERFKKEKL